LKNKKTRIVSPDGTITYSEGKVPDHEFMFNAAYTMASGGMVLSGDDVGDLDEPRIALLKKLLPPTKVAAEFDDDSFTTGKAVIDETKTILYAFNFEEEAKDVEWSIDGTAHVLDLFEDKDMGVLTDKIRYADLQPHSAKVLICNKI
jgi:alpha-galactosidase